MYELVKVDKLVATSSFKILHFTFTAKEVGVENFFFFFFRRRLFGLHLFYLIIGVFWFYAIKFNSFPRLSIISLYFISLAIMSIFGTRDWVTDTDFNPYFISLAIMSIFGIRDWATDFNG